MKKIPYRLYFKVFSPFIALFFYFPVSAQVKDSMANSPIARMRAYKTLITSKAKTYNSFVSMHQVDDKYYMEIPDSLLGREILTVNRLGRAAADFRTADNPLGYAGDLIGENLFHFEKGPGNKLFVKMKSYKERATDTTVNGMKRSLDRNNSESLVQAFAIKATNDSTHTTVIELTEYLNQDNLLFGFAQQMKTASGLGLMVNDRSYLESVKGYPDNLFIRMVRTYNKPVSKGSSALAPFTFEINSSMILLPKQLMNVRTADKRVPFQQVDYIDFDQNPLGVINLGNIYRWRLIPADLKAYNEGKLSKPKSPIKMFLDPQIPQKWLPYLAEGILAWNKAFEKAGFQNAIEVVSPHADSGSVYLENAHLSGVVFKPGSGESWGSIIRDPRTGEILQAQLNFYLQDLNKLYNQYLVQAGAVDQQAHHPAFSTALMGNLLATYISQQMGNALGLKSNGAASSAIPVANLRNNNWLNNHAFNGSITDPVLLNYAAQPQDGIDPKNLLAKISESDLYTINWGYRYFPAPENKTLSALILDRSNKGLQMYSGEAPTTGNKNILDPRNQNGDLSNDAVEAGNLGIANLKKVVPNLLSWTVSLTQGYQPAGEAYKILITQYSQYLRHAANLIGGVAIDIKNSDQKGDVFRFVPLAKQQQALQFIQLQAFKTPQWLNSPKLYQRTETDFDLVGKVQKELLNDLLDNRTLAKLVTAENSGEKGYSPVAYLNDLSAGIFSELNKHEPLNMNRRELQKVYVNKLVVLVQGSTKSDSDLSSVLRMHAGTLLKKIKTGSGAYQGVGAAHLTDLYERLYIGLHNPAQPERSNTNPFSIAR
ncbi:zinc-dependent metalloprotease [Pedobacter miscanthi]|uniref:zinc-dependent metalloprotease n=1 Tax=Pedobacter miscanthi TaxID=2259170 RepID=UPI002930F40B|nr:zinc-dependent metalloprotease [Pedobacter miscanthi]